MVEMREYHLSYNGARQCHRQIKWQWRTVNVLKNRQSVFQKKWWLTGKLVKTGKKTESHRGLDKRRRGHVTAYTDFFSSIEKVHQIQSFIGPIMCRYSSRL